MENQKIDYKWLKESNLILYEVISGSIAYGTNLPTSDEDRRYVYILPIDYILSGNIVEQVNDDTNDVVGYEIGRFLNLISSANPNLLELLNMPEDCIVYKNPIFDLILDNKSKFLTKKCKNSFAGYGHAKGPDRSQGLSCGGPIRTTLWRASRSGTCTGLPGPCAAFGGLAPRVQDHGSSRRRH